MAERRFDDGFLFGAATAAFQIEGGHTDGRTDSIWDVFCRLDGAVINGDDGSVACDHYHRYGDDVAVMAALGLQSYRFSTSWARVQPDARAANPKGLDFYAKLVDELLEHDILPWLTLYHWDLPQTLQEDGGWANRDTAYRFADYARLVHDRLGDRVRVWTTLNEPWCSAFLGYAAGAHAPGIQDPAQSLAAAHHLMLGHGLVVQQLRSADENLSLGLTLNLTPYRPADPQAEPDLEAARQLDGQTNRIFLDPIFRGRYPADVLADVAGLGLEEVIRDGDLEIISTPIDVLGVNYYQDAVVSGTPTGPVTATEAPTDRVTGSPFPAVHDVYPVEQDVPRTDMGWVISPDGLRQLLHRVHAEYAGPAGHGSLRDRERRGLRRPGRRRRQRAGRRPRRLPACPPRRRPSGGRRGRTGEGLLLLVFDGQLRVGLGLREALRHRARRLRDAAAYGQGVRLGVRRDHRRPQPRSRRHRR